MSSAALSLRHLKKWHFTSDGSPIICTISHPLLEHCILSAGRLHLAESAFRICEPYPYFYRSHDFATGRYHIYPTSSVASTKHPHQPPCKYRFPFLSFFQTLFFSASLACCIVQHFPFAISSNYYCPFAASKDGGKISLVCSERLSQAAPRVDIDACGRNIVMKESQVSSIVVQFGVSMLGCRNALVFCRKH